MVLDTALLSTQHYKVKIKDKVEQSWELSSVLPYILDAVATEKGVFRSPSTKVANFTFILKICCSEFSCIELYKEFKDQQRF